MIRASAYTKPSIWCPGIRRDHPLARGLVGLWPFWDGTGGRLMDVSSCNNGGTLTNLDPLDWIARSEGYGLEFETGTSEHVQVPYAQFAGLLEITVAAQFRLDTHAAYDYTRNLWAITDSGDPGSMVGLTAWARSGPTSRLTWMAYQGAKFYANYGVVGSTNLTLGQTYTGAATVDAGYTYVYLDGKQDASEAATAAPSDIDDIDWCGIGGIKQSGAIQTGRGWDGVIDWVCVWNRALSSCEVAEWDSDVFAIARPRRRTYFWAAVSGGAPPVGNRRRRLLLVG